MKGRDVTVEPKPPKEEIKKIRAALRLRADDPFPRCMGKHVHRGKEAGHDEPGHLCDHCRCKHIAGHGTKHYGYGYCMCHENANQYKDHAVDMAHAQKVATQQGQPENVYKYLTSIEGVEGIQEAADAAQGRHKLKGEIVLLKEMLQALMSQVAERVRAAKEKPPEEPGVVDKLLWIEARSISTKEINAVATLTRTIATLAKTELEITDSDYIHIDQMITWFTAVFRVIEEMVLDPQLIFDIKAEMAHIPQPITGKY